ncbi:hypothetical protein [Acrocarpospora corrugata]|uniref:hypothetical protein n=1 Tax=Acrocarpospora corrugata TaxID=35763 RepID=UPI0012D2ED4A|nr:hypothetical protein [Acrocarpospora corrugata]
MSVVLSFAFRAGDVSTAPVPKRRGHRVSGSELRFQAILDLEQPPRDAPDAAQRRSPAVFPLPVFRLFGAFFVLRAETACASEPDRLAHCFIQLY